VTNEALGKTPEPYKEEEEEKEIVKKPKVKRAIRVKPKPIKRRRPLGPGGLVVKRRRRKAV
jgi:hypothetical protein